MSAPGFRQLLVLLSALLFAGCAGGGKLIESRGSEAVRKLPFCGVSGPCADERTAREEARQDALAQIAMFDGVGVDYRLLAESMEKDGEISQSVQSSVLVISRSLIRTLSFEYYLEISKAPQGKQYQAWCHIPWSEELKERFLTELTDLTYQPVSSLMDRITLGAGQDPESFINALSRAISYYSEAIEQASAWFSTPNLYTAALDSRFQTLISEKEDFYNHLEIDCSSSSPNRMRLNISFKGTPYRAKLSVDPLPEVIDSFAVIPNGAGFEICFYPFRSGEYPLRYRVDSGKFPLEPYSRVIATPLKLEHPFAGNTVGISCLDATGVRPETAAALANLVNSLEGKVISVEPNKQDSGLNQARDLKCQYLISAVADIAEIRENPQQGLFIAFPTLDLKIQELATGKSIFASRYPNSVFPDLRARAKTKDVAIQEGYAFSALFSDPVFIQAIRSLK